MTRLRIVGRQAEAVLTLAIADVAVRMFGLVCVVRLLSRFSHPRPRRRASVPDPDPQELASLAESLESGSAFYVRPVHCVERSLSLFLMARRRGIAVNFHIGVKKFPFTSHAWVADPDDHPVFLDEADLVSTLSPILTVRS